MGSALRPWPSPSSGLIDAIDLVTVDLIQVLRSGSKDNLQLPSALCKRVLQ